MKTNAALARPSLAVCLILFAAGCAMNPVTGRKQLVLMSESQELAMGKEADPQIMAYFGAYNDGALRQSDELGVEYSSRIG
jgi:predicted Zn-dependent protease